MRRDGCHVSTPERIRHSCFGRHSDDCMSEVVEPQAGKSGKCYKKLRPLSKRLRRDLPTASTSTENPVPPDVFPGARSGRPASGRNGASNGPVADLSRHQGYLTLTSQNSRDGTAVSASF